MEVVILFVMLAGCHFVDALDNGVGLRPIIGWTTGSRYSCLTDCEHYPEECISDHLVKVVADFLSLTSFQTAGYEYIVLGDCWMDGQRDEKGRLRADRRRFPNGMADLVSYVHKKKLKIGLHLDLGSKTCGGYPGSLNNYELDAGTLASWDVDMVTVSACGFDRYYYLNDAYIKFGEVLMREKRSILYACDWPKKIMEKGGGHPSYKVVSQTCNSFRITNPVDSFESLMSIIANLRSTSYLYRDFLGNGTFLDLDEVVVGGYVLSESQEKFQMAFWAMISSPMLVSSDLAALSFKSKRLLLNKDIIGINQDPLTMVAKDQWWDNVISAWTKPILPSGSFAVAIFSTNVVGLPAKVSIQLSNVGVSGSSRYNVTEIFSSHHYGVFKPWHYLNCEVEPMGALLFKFIPI